MSWERILRINGKTWLIIFLLVSSVTSSIIIYVSPELWWDESVYVSMGKFIYSQGKTGYTEVFRPPLYPAFLGLFWFLGADPVLAGKLIATASFLLMIFLTYLIGKEAFNELTGLLAAYLLAFTPFVYIYTTKVLTESFSTAFVLLSIWCILKWKDDKRGLIPAGIFAGLAFLARFPQGALLIGVLTALAVKAAYSEMKENRLKGLAREACIILVFFIIVIMPYLVSNYFAYKDPLMPLLAAKKQIDFTAWFHESSPLYYLLALPKENIFLIMFIPGLYFFFRNRAWLDYRKNVVFMVFIAFLLYMSLFEGAKDIRFAIVMLPYVSIASAYGIEKTAERFRGEHVKGVMVVIWVIALLSSTFILSTNYVYNITTEKPDTVYDDFIMYFRDKETAVITSNIIIAAYTDSRIISLGEWEFAAAEYNRNRDKAEYLALDTCSLPYNPECSHCERDKESFIDFSLKSHELLYTSIHERYGQTCTYYIFRINKNAECCSQALP